MAASGLCCGVQVQSSRRVFSGLVGARSRGSSVICNLAPGMRLPTVGVSKPTCIVNSSRCSILGAHRAVRSTCHASRRPQRVGLQVRAVFEKFTERSIKAVMYGQAEAREFGTQEVSTEHILLGLIQEEKLSKNGYLNSGLNFDKAKQAIEAISAKQRPNTSQDTIPFSREVRKCFEAATNECKRLGVNYIAPEHIVVALLNMPECGARRLLESLSVDCEAVKTEAQKRLKGEQEAEMPKKKKTPAASDKEVTKALDEFCRDLCQEVRQGKIDPVVGREKEVSRVTQVLARRTKNNPILLGEPGVGKTAIAEGLAVAIVNRCGPDGTPLPEFLEKKRVMQLDVGLLIAGAKERGELENRVTKLLAEVRESGDVVLMIDEVHTLVGAGAVGRGGHGGGGGGLDISNLLKPALARGELQCIGATTVNEHRKYIERDPALERRFQPVMVEEPSASAAVHILEGLRERYERHHRCAYTHEALEAAVKLSHRYIADRFLPDKAIDLMDEAGSRARINAFMSRKSRGMVENAKVREYMQVLESKDEAVKDALYEEAVILRRREMDYKAELAGPAEVGSSLPLVDVGDIERIVSVWSGIPVEKLTDDESLRLSKLSDVLKEHIIGQDDAVEATAKAMARARCELKDPDRPIAAMLFVGPTGVGKTELTNVLAEHMFGDRSAIIRMDMSEYMERHSVSKLIGAPPGYVGYGEGGTLTEAVRRKPCSVVLFDEVEKAHPDVFSILLQILEDGRLTDSQGRTVSFKNTLVILTSNIGSRALANGSGALGMFKYRDFEYDAQYDRAQMVSIVQDEVKQYFRPELINRLDETVVFNKLGMEEVRSIARLMVDETAGRLAANKGLGLHVMPAVMDLVIRQGYSEEWGVRPLRNTIVKYIDDPLCDALLHKKLGKGAVAMLDLNTDSGEVMVYERDVSEVEALQAEVPVIDLVPAN